MVAWLNGEGTEQMGFAYLCGTEKQIAYIEAEACVDIAPKKGIREEKGGAMSPRKDELDCMLATACGSMAKSEGTQRRGCVRALYSHTGKVDACAPQRMGPCENTPEGECF